MKIKAVLFNIDDTFYDTSLQRENARLNAVRAMVEAGLPLDIENGYRTLQKIIEKYGSNYQKHFDALLEHLGLKWNPRVIAAGVVAYRYTNQAFLRPFPDTIPTLLRLREEHLKLGVLSWGRPVKQWQKLIQLGIQHFFDQVIISDETRENFQTQQFTELIRLFSVKANETVFIGSNLNEDVSTANRMGIISIRIKKGKGKIEAAHSQETKSIYEISALSELPEILQKINNSD